MRKSALIFVLVVFAILISGCETAKGAAQGAQLDFQTAKRGTMKCWQVLKSADDWMQRNMW